MPTIEIHGAIYEARLSLKAVEAAEREGEQGFPNLLIGALEESRLTDLLTLVTAVLRGGWPGVTREGLWQALEMDDPAVLPVAAQRLRTLLLAVLDADLPDVPAEADPKNACRPPHVGGPTCATWPTAY